MPGPVLSTAELADRLADPLTIPIDARPIAAYNGWPLRGEARGGHIWGALALSHSWTAHPDWIEALRSRAGGREPRPVVYGYEAEAAADLAFRLRAEGYHDVALYHDFAEWAADPRLPMGRLPRHRQLVHPGWLDEQLDGGRPAQQPGRLVLCHAGYDYRQDYQAGHIPGAIYLDTLYLESPADWNRIPPAELAATLCELGIRRDSTVVVYGRTSEADPADPRPGRYAGQLAAMRCAAILLHAGVEDVRVLDGGLAAWEAAGHAVTGQEQEPRPVADFGGEVPGRPDLMIDLPEARALLAAADGALVSVRSPREFAGEVSGYNYIDRTGDIPGAIFGNCGSDAYHMENYRNPDQTVRDYRQLAAAWAAAGIVPGKRLAFYCGTGWRASEAFFGAWLMGWPRIAVYDGGWLEWSRAAGEPAAASPPRLSRESG